MSFPQTFDPSTLSLGAIGALTGAAFVAGFVDAIAGGGGLITVPALLAAGLPTHLALGTNKGQSVFGATASVVSFARRGSIDRARAAPAFVLALVGAFAGAAIQLAVPSGPLRPIALGLLVAAAAMVALRPLFLRGERKSPTSPAPLIAGLIALSLGAYDGFFGPGTGSLLVIAYVTFLGDAMTSASGNAKVANFGSNLASVILFAIRGTVLWKISLPMAVGNSIGAAIGVRVALKRGDNFVRVVLLVVVVALVMKLGWDLAH
ncbi:sulfite exporter TauE/SafE family protein [soil metagenome]